MIKVAAITRGYAHDFQWKADWLGFADSVSDIPIRNLMDSYGVKECIRTEVPGVAISKKGSNFALLVTGLATSYKAERPGPITASFAIFDLNERGARIFAAHVLRDWIKVSEKLVSFILRNAPPACASEWSIDVEGFSNYVSSVIGAAAPSEVTHSVPRRSRDYSPPENPEFTKFADLVGNQSFSQGEGVKVVIGKEFSGKNKASLLDTADLIVLPGLAVSDDIDADRAKKKPNLSPIPSSPARSAVLISCAIVGALVLIWMFGGGHKKKEIERLGLVEVEHKALRLNIFFDEVSAEDLKQALDVQTPETWTTKLLGWNPDTRSFSLEFTPLGSKRTGTFSIAFPFAVKKRNLEVNSLPPWTVKSEWGGEELILRVHSPD